MTLTYTEKNPWEPKTGDIVLLRWVPESRIPRHHAQYVQRHVDRLAKENDLGKVRVRWFRAAEDRILKITRKNGSVIDVVGLTERDRPQPHASDEFWIEAEGDGTGIAMVMREFPNTICLYASLRGDELPHVIAHEIRHLVQQRDSLAGDQEADADQYGAAYQRRAG